MAIEFKLPELGENIEAGDVVSVLVEEGATIDSGQNVLEIETDKAVVELPCPHAGRVAKLHVKTGDRIPIGALVLTIDPDGGMQAAAEAEAETPSPEPASAGGTREPRPERTPPPREETPAAPLERDAPADVATPGPSPAPAPDAVGPTIAAGPATRRLARELGVDLALVSGSGRGGRVTQDDVQAFVRRHMSGAPSARVASSPIDAPPLPDFSQWGPIERQPLSGIRRKTAEAMSLAWRLVPQVTQYDTADITDLEAGRRRFIEQHRDAPAKVTVTVMAVKAVVAALKAFPQFNASFDAENQQLILKRYYDIGVAVDTEHGLLVPVIRGADRKSVLELTTELDVLSGQARERKLALEQMRGGTFTISNLGGIGGTGFSPIVYHPDVAILGMSRARQEQVIVDGTPRIRLMLPLSLSYDHRVIDGADGARFLRKVAQLLSDPVALLLEA